MTLHPLLTRDPASGGELIVTRLECPTSGVVIEGRFSLGWIGKLTPEQLDFVGVLLRYRNNVQRIANELGVAYNTARSRLDDIVDVLGGEQAGDRAPAAPTRPGTAGDKQAILDALAAGTITVEDALVALRASKGTP